MKRYFLFDLDGTLCDTGPGIMESAQYTLDFFGFPKQSEESLRRMIGPPLDVSLREFFGLQGKDNLRAVEKFREYYRRKGLFECKLYPGIRELLARFSGTAILCVATSKPEYFAQKILELRGVLSFFPVLVGSRLGGIGTPKAGIISEVLEKLQDPPKEEVVMIGDRSYDVLGAKACGIDCIGVEYGFASPGELSAAGADYVVPTVEELGKLLEVLS